MAQQFNVNEVRFTTVTYSGGQVAAGSIVQFSNHDVNGQLLEVDWNANIIGSLTLKTSGNGITLWQNKAPSGLGWQVAHPGVLNQLSTGSIAGGFIDTFYLCEPLALVYDIGSNAVANVSGLSFTVNARYR